MKSKPEYSKQKIAKNFPAKKKLGETQAEIAAEIQDEIQKALPAELNARQLAGAFPSEVAAETGSLAGESDQPILLAMGEGKTATDAGTQGIGAVSSGASTQAASAPLSVAIPEASAIVSDIAALGATTLGAVGAAASAGGGISWGWIAGGVAAVGAAAGGGGGGATASAPSGVTGLAISLSSIAAGNGGFIINGQGATDLSGFSVSSAGDVNGDGLGDLIVGALHSDPAAGIDAGRSYVVFGKSTGTAIDLSAIAAGTGGFVINGQCAGDQSGWSVASAGDINGDGLGDLIVGARASDPAGVNNAGRSYVVFGKSTTTAIDLSAIAAGTGGFVINGKDPNGYSGASVSSAGDVNGDGLGDMIVGSVNGSLGAGTCYVVFGQTATTAVDLSAVAAGTGGFIISGQSQGEFIGSSVSRAGDVNGDGLGDLIIGAEWSDPAAGSNAGRSYVVFGQSATTAIDLLAVASGAGGFVVNGQGASDYSGRSVASAGDVNGDGLADLIVGASRSDPAGVNGAGRSYVVFGKSTTTAIDLSAIAAGTGGFVINGQGAIDYSGGSVASAGDINGDGLGDLIVGATNSNLGAGGGYVVFGKTGTSAVELSAIAQGTGGFVIAGQFNENSGNSVASAGDVNGDGLSDLIVGADNGGAANAGRSYVIFGSTAGAFAQTAVDQLGSGGNDTLTGSAVAETLVGGAGNDTLIGNGGADVLYGGAGDDIITLNAGNLTALGAGVTGGQLARVDGGSGIDTLQLDGALITLNLSTIANQGGSSPGSSSRIESIERIDLTGTGNNTLTLSLNDVIDMSGMNVFNNANGWADGTYNLGGVTGVEQRHQVVIDGNAGDAVNSTGWGASAGTVTNNAITYDVYNQGSYAQLLIAQGVTATVI